MEKIKINKEPTDLAKKLMAALTSKMEKLNLEDKLTDPAVKSKIKEVSDIIYSFSADTMVNGFTTDIEVFKKGYADISKMVEDLN